MNTLRSGRRRLVVIAASFVVMTLAVAGTSLAQSHRGGSSGRGGYAPSSGGMRAYSGARVYANSGARRYGGVTYRGWSSGQVGRPGTTYYRRGGGYGYYGGGWYRPYRYYYPRSFVHLGVGFYDPYYYDYYPYPYVVERQPIVVDPAPTDDPSTSVDVTNDPPAGCYYYDRFCDLRFDNLDAYTDHLRHKDHAQTIDIVDKDSGDRVRSLRFDGQVWRVDRPARDQAPRDDEQR